MLSQKRSDFTIVFVDDHSRLTREQQNYIKSVLKKHIVIFNSERKYALRNAYEVIHEYVPDRAIVINLDGDDQLLDPDVISQVESIYRDPAIRLSYGNCLVSFPGRRAYQPVGSLDRHTHTLNDRYSSEEERRRLFALLPFRPFHLRTWRAAAFKQIDVSLFKRLDDSWIHFAEDMAIYLPLLASSQGNYAVLSEPLSVYQAASPHADRLLHPRGRLRDEVLIRKKNYQKNKKYCLQPRDLTWGAFRSLLRRRRELGAHVSLWRHRVSLPTDRSELSLLSLPTRPELHRFMRSVRGYDPGVVMSLFSHLRVDFSSLAFSSEDEYQNVMFLLLFSQHFSSRAKKTICHFFQSSSIPF